MSFQENDAGSEQLDDCGLLRRAFMIVGIQGMLWGQQGWVLF